MEKHQVGVGKLLRIDPNMVVVLVPTKRHPQMKVSSIRTVYQNELWFSSKQARKLQSRPKIPIAHRRQASACRVS